MLPPARKAPRQKTTTVDVSDMDMADITEELERTLLECSGPRMSSEPEAEPQEAEKPSSWKRFLGLSR
jgi:hypothetical protein